MKSMLSLAAAAVLCASTSFAQDATDAIQGQAGVTTVDGGNPSTATIPAVEPDTLFADTNKGLSSLAKVGLVVGALVVVGAIANSDSSNSTTGTN